jgi:hypothetical protein
MKTQHVVVISPNDGTHDSSLTRKYLKEAIKPSSLNLTVNGIRNISRGGVLVQCDTPTDCQKVVQAITAKGQECKVSASIPNKKRPQLISFNIDDFNQTDFIPSLIDCNQDISTYLSATNSTSEDHFKIKRVMSTKSSATTKHVILEVSPKM